MNDPKKPAFDTISQAEIEPVLELLKGGDPDDIAKKAGITRAQLIRMRDALLDQAEHVQAAQTEVPKKKIGRNAPCTCGSGKKYKHCCMRIHETARRSGPEMQAEDRADTTREQKELIDHIEKAFALMRSRQYEEAIRAATKLLENYPNEDRLHDIVSTSHLYAGSCDRAVTMCKNRWEVSKAEKAYFTQYGHYRDEKMETPALSYYYPPLTWLQKYWIALKMKEYRGMYPETENPEIIACVKALQTADDPNRFPERHAKGLEIRKNALQKTLDRLKTTGPEVIGYLLPLACQYSWAGIFVPDILFSYKTEPAICGLIDISMFGFAYASGASLNCLEQMGEMVIPHIEEAFEREKVFDPIKTGIVSILGNIRGPAAYEILLRLLAHESPHIVNWAGGALGKFGNREALPMMVAASRKIGGEQMIDGAIEKLKNLPPGI